MAAMQHIRPLGNRVLVKRSEVKMSRGGILLPETAKEKPRQGEVVAVGPGKIDEKGNLKPSNYTLAICPFFLLCRNRMKKRMIRQII